MMAEANALVRRVTEMRDVPLTVPLDHVGNSASSVTARA